MRGDRRPPPGAAPCPGEDSELRACVNIRGLNRAASRELFWPSHVGRCEGPSHSYVRMPFGLSNVAATFQRHMQSVLATHGAMNQAIPSEVVMDPREPPEPPEVRDLGSS